MLDTLLVALVISIDTAQVKEFPQKAEVEFKKNDLKENIIKSLSGYRWSNGLGYYAEVEDAATNFFFDHLGKGVYVLEHSYRIARGGTYETGLATIQCAYAPEYASHSAGGIIVIK